MCSIIDTYYSRIKYREFKKEINGVMAPDLKEINILMAETKLTIDNPKIKNHNKNT